MVVCIEILTVASGNYAPCPAVMRGRRNDRVFVIIPARFSGQQTLVVAEHGIILGVGEGTTALDQAQCGPALRGQIGDTDDLCAGRDIGMAFSNLRDILLNGRCCRSAIYKSVIAACQAENQICRSKDNNINNYLFPGIRFDHHMGSILQI